MMTLRGRTSPEATSAMALQVEDVVPIGVARRTLDVAVGSLGLIVLSPVLALVAILTGLTSRGGAIFRQPRVGEGGRPFTIFKFRTMRRAAAGPDITAQDDERVTRVGRFLRRLGADELPQLWNVVRSDMTLVGPRPETMGLALRYPITCQYIFRYRPGLTGLTQLAHRAAAGLDAVAAERRYLEEDVPRRVALDMVYLVHPSIRRTLNVLAHTIVLAFESLVGVFRRRTVEMSSAPEERIRRILRRWNVAPPGGVEDATAPEEPERRGDFQPIG